MSAQKIVVIIDVLIVPSQERVVLVGEGVESVEQAVVFVNRFFIVRFAYKTLVIAREGVEALRVFVNALAKGRANLVAIV